MKSIYLDNAATTQVDPEVVRAMLPYFTNSYGNASEPHIWGIEANRGIENARSKIANFIGAQSDEIVFTSCSTESINLSHKGLIENFKFEPHIITTSIEHKAVLEACKHMKASVTYLPVDYTGMVNVKEIEDAITNNTVLISVMYVNNEVGTVEPIARIGEMIKEYNRKHIENRIYFHTDATQAIQYFDCNVDRLGVDLLSFTGHKIHAPKGIGALYIRKDTPIARQQDGGGQEFGLRAGTENVPYIVGLGRAVELINSVDKEEIRKLRNKLVDWVLNNIPDSKLTGHTIERAPHIASFVFKGVRGDDVVNEMSDRGIACASGSACTAGSIDVSHVMKALQIPNEWAQGQVRFSLSKHTKSKDIAQTCNALKEVIEKLRTTMF